MKKSFSILTTMAIGLIAVLSCTKDDAEDIPSAHKSIVVDQSTTSSFTASITGRFVDVNKADLALGKRGLFYCLKTADAEMLFNSWLEGVDNPGFMELDNVTIESEKIYCTLEGLFPDTEYDYCLYLQKRDGTREISAVSSFRTQPFNPDISEVSLDGIQCFVAFAEGGIIINVKDAANFEIGFIVSGQINCNINNSTAYSCNIEGDNLVKARISDLESNKDYYCRLYVKYLVSSGQYEYVYGPESAFRTKDFSQMAVDLGLPSGLLWATCNVGADNPEDYGDYYAWGETETYYETGYAQAENEVIWKTGKSAGYVWASYKYCLGNEQTLTKYCNNADFGFHGFTDNKTVLEPDDDVAHVQWGGGWRMPTGEEMDELRSPKNCTCTWTTQNGVQGLKITSKKSGYTDRSIFLPAAESCYSTSIQLFNPSEQYSGYYMSSSLTTDPRLARGLDFNFEGNIGGGGLYRQSGCLVRPVYR